MKKEKVSENKEQIIGGFVPRKKSISSVVLDVFVVLFCLTGVAVSLYLFQRDLFTALRSLSAPVGTVSIKYNTVQRRIQDRMIWDRLFDDSPVYDGDLIRVDRLSGATINIADNQIDLGENTLIRVQKGADGLNLNFLGGNINVTTQESSETIFLTSGDRVIQAAPGTSFSVSSDDDGVFILRVTEGTAHVTQGDKVIEAVTGDVIVQDTQGNEVREPVAVVSRPQQNAYLINNELNPLNVEFAWVKVNIPQDDRMRLEISDNINFSNIEHTISNLGTMAETPLNSGVWFWRLLHEDKSLAAGRITVVTEIPASSVIAEEPQPEPEPEPPAILEESSAPVIAETPLPRPLAQTILPSLIPPTPLSPPPAQTMPEPLRDFSVRLLPPPEKMSPDNRFTIGIEELKVHRNIVFTWSEVAGANSYILTIFREGFPRHRQIFQTGLLTNLTFTFDDLSLLENHDNIFWNVEAVFVNEEGTIEKRGEIKEYGIVLNVPSPGRVRTRGMGVMYGTE
ncbi:MAG: FecR family protein [Treponema sp.]|nr:FecR family protein [Treponema sp.]